MRFVSMRKYIVTLLVLLLSACGASEPQLKRLSPLAVVVAFGDSLTSGFGAPPGMGYPEVLEKLIGHKVINAGVPGEETAGGLARIDTVMATYHPELVIVCLGGNDNLRKRNPSQIKANLEGIVKAIQAQGAQVVLIAAPVFNMGLAVPDYYQQIGEEYSIPVDTATLKKLIIKPDLKSDLIHFNADGYQAFAKSVAQFLREREAI